MGIRIKPIGGQQASMYKLNARKQHESHVFSFIPPLFFLKSPFLFDLSKYYSVPMSAVACIKGKW